MTHTAICLATGPSLTADDVAFCQGKGKVYAVNDAYKLAPWADVFYACDAPWWEVHGDALAELPGEKWTGSEEAPQKFHWLKKVKMDAKQRWSKTPGVIATGGNSGFQAINLAAIHGASRIILLGYDHKYGANGKKHFFGDHPTPIDRGSNYFEWMKRLELAAQEIDVEVINCSPDSAIECFRKAPLREVLV